MLVASLLEAHVVVGADAGEHCDLFAAEPVYPPAAGEVADADVARPDQLTAGAQVVADRVLARHWHNDTPAVASSLALRLLGTPGLWCAGASWPSLRT